MKINELLQQSIQRLEAANVPTARLDCLVLFEDILNTNRTQILAHPERELTEVELQKIIKLVDKRAQHIPLAYLRGKTEFYGREFTINTHILEPRPESETMIELLKQLPPDRPPLVIDIGTGSGALAITAALELPNTPVIATDISPDCIKLARKNAQSHNVNVDFYEGDLLAALPTSVTKQPMILLCNLPYVPADFAINTAATHEPRIAIFGGEDGLELFRRLFSQLTPRTSTTYVLCESMPPQHEALTDIAGQAGFQLLRDEDFIQVFMKP